MGTGCTWIMSSVSSDNCGRGKRCSRGEKFSMVKNSLYLKLRSRWKRQIFRSGVPRGARFPLNTRSVLEESRQDLATGWRGGRAAPVVKSYKMIRWVIPDRFQTVANCNRERRDNCRGSSRNDNFHRVVTRRPPLSRGGGRGRRMVIALLHLSRHRHYHE